VQKLEIQVLRSQKFELGTYYMGLCLEYNGQVESIPQIARPEGLEYQVSSLVKRMTHHKRKVAFTTGHGESDTTQGFQSLKQDLEQEFEVGTVNPSSAEIGADVEALVIGGPKQAIDEKGQKEIDRFLMKGKGAVVLVDGMALSSPGGAGGMEQMQIKMAQANDSGLGRLLETYGFKVGQDFVFDRQSVAGPMQIGGRTMLMSLPFFVAAEAVKAPDLSVLEGIHGIVFPFGSSVELVGPLKDGKPSAGAKLWKIASSSKEGWQQTGFFVLSPQMKLDSPKEHKAFAFGYAFNGPLKSAFAPAVPTADSSKDKPLTESVKPVRLVMMGDSDFAHDEYVQLARFLPFYGAGAQLLFNAISWTIEDESLTPLRSKTLNPRPIKVASEGVATALQYGNVLGLPIAFCLFGIVRWRLRRATRAAQRL
jgi:ABC-type uncharacterized transport system involved in gliding motility auxiliary subunit